MSVRSGTIETQIDHINQHIKEFEREVEHLHDILDPECDKDLVQMMKTQEQLETYYEMKEMLEKMLKAEKILEKRRA